MRGTCQSPCPPRDGERVQIAEGNHGDASVREAAKLGGGSGARRLVGKDRHSGRVAELGSTGIQASVEFARRRLSLPAELRGFVRVPVRRAYPFTLPRLPVIAKANACAEKLARYRRAALGVTCSTSRSFAKGALDERLVRRL